MKLRRLSISSMPGITAPYEISFEDGVTVVEGPNESGKSSVCRALRALLWSSGHRDAYLRACATFEDDHGELQVERDGPQVSWTRSGESIPRPPLPGDNQADSFFLGLEELVDLDTRQGTQVSEAIRREMVGGYDMAKALASFSNPESRGFASGKSKALSKTEQAVNQEYNAQAKLARSEAQLETLKQQAAALKARFGRIQALETCQRLAHLHGELRDAEGQLELLPDTLAALNGNELGLVDERIAELEANALGRIDHDKRIADAEQTAAETELAEPVSQQTLDTLDALATELSAVRGELKSADKDLAGADSALAQARQEAGVQDGIDLADQSELFEFLREVGKLEDNRASLAKLLRTLAGRVPRPDDKKASVDEGRRVLSRWLSAPLGVLPGAGAAPPLTRFILPLGIVGGLLGVLLLILGNAFWQLPLGLAAGLLVAALLKGRRAAPDPTAASQGNRRADLEHDYPSDLSAPGEWSEAAVASRQRELDETCGQWASWDHMEREREDLRNELADLDGKHQAAAERLQTLCATLGLDLELPATEQYLFAKRLDRLARKELDQQQLLGEMESCSARLQQFMAHINSDLAALDEEELADPVEVLPALSSLRQRSTDLVNARKQGAVARADLAALDEQAANLEQKLAQLYAAAGLEPGQYSDLSALVEQVEHYKDTVETRKALTRTISETAKSLPEEGSEQLLALGSSELEDELELAQAAQEKHTACEGEIHEIEAEVAHAKRHSTMRDALARRQRAVEDLSSDYDDALDGLAGRMLLERALAHHERDQAPPVLQRARKLFGRFTDHAYELRVPAAGSGSFTAYQVNTKQVRRPAELSTGTRAQLFIAARLAFTEVVHEGQQLPIVLDEALDHSDPTRFASIVASLGELSQPKAEGSRPRQLIYLTSDPQDAQRIELALEFAGYAAPHHIDLGELRDMAQETLSMAEFIPPKGSPPPPPGKLDAAEYGALLGVTPLAPANGAQAQHLFHLLADDLNVLHELLSARIETVGECRAAFGNDSDFAESIEGRLREEPTIIQRCELLDEFCRAWNSGRGRPITREVLLGVEGLADSWHDKLWPMIEELKGDGRAFISRLRAKSDKRSSRIKGNTVDDIECSLMDSGHVSDSPVLTDNQVCQHVQASSAAACLSAPRVAALAKRWCAQAQLFPADSER